MKKSTLMKLVFTLAAMFVFAGLNAQILVSYSADQVAEPNSYQTAGKDFKLYVMPDPVYSPTYDAATNANLGAAALWTWTYATLSGNPATGVATAQNWITFTAPTVGVYPVTVAESNSLGGCIDPTPISVTVNVVAAPTGVVTTLDPAQACGNVAATPVVVTFTENVPNTMAGYAFGINEIVEEIDPLNNVIATPVASHSLYDFKALTAGAKCKTGTAGFVAATPSFTFTFNTAALNVSNNHRTRYTYTLVNASDVATAGVVSSISQKSDFGGALTSYAFGAKTTYVAIVNPTPTTGPIYHISNTYAY
jgi:hypothetical protein